LHINVENITRLNNAQGPSMTHGHMHAVNKNVIRTKGKTILKSYSKCLLPLTATFED